MLIVTYDLKTPNDRPEDYRRVIDGIQKEYSDNLHIEDSVFLLKTADGPQICYGKVYDLIKPGDSLFVGVINSWWANKEMSPQIRQIYGETGA